MTTKTKEWSPALRKPKSCGYCGERGHNIRGCPQRGGARSEVFQVHLKPGERDFLERIAAEIEATPSELLRWALLALAADGPLAGAELRELADDPPRMRL